MSETVKIDAVTALPSKSKYRKYAPVIIISCGIFIVIVVAYHKYSSSSTNSLSDSELAFTDTFGESYDGGGLDKLYDKIGGSESLNNGNLSSQIDVDTGNYSCSFDVTYKGDKKKRVECRSGCFIDDDNSKFCEKYIYNSRVDGGGSLDTIYDDAGGNESGSISRLISKINVDAGDKTCGFYVDYEGNNKRTVEVTGSGSPICNKFAYGDGNKGDLWETLIDDTYISGRRDLDRSNKDADDHDLTPASVTPSTGTTPGPTPGQPRPPPTPPSDDSSAPVIKISLFVVCIIIFGVIVQKINRSVPAGYKRSSENIIGMWSFIFIVSFSLFVGSIDGMIGWKAASAWGRIGAVILNILAVIITVSISIMGGKSLQRGLHLGESAMAPIVFGVFGVLGLAAFIVSFIVV